MKDPILNFFRNHGIKFLLVVTIIAGAGAGSKYFEISKNLDIYATLYKEVNELYVEEINSSQLMQEGINSMLESLDPYTTFIPESDIEDHRFMTTGQYGGIGASITSRDGKIMVSEVYQDAPADQSGLIPGDRIIQVGEVEVSGMSTSEVSELLKGQPDTEAEVIIEREGEDENLTKHITRQQVQVDNVPFYGMIDEKTGFIKLTSFRRGATNEVRQAFENLRDQEGMERVVLDLRDNPGGLLNESIDMVNLFVPRGELIVSTQGRVEQWEQEYKTSQEPLDTEIPLAVLINESSASASEIVAGAMQDLDRGIVIGRSSFGKGSVQTTRQLSYNTQLKITTAKYYIPSGRSIERIGDAVEDSEMLDIDEDRPTEFTTRNGREVYESDGIDPDIETESISTEPMIRDLQRNFHIFDFATKYHRNNESISSALEFDVEDELFEEFRDFIVEKDYSFQESVEREFDQFVKRASEDEEFGEIKEEVDKIRDHLKKDIDKQLSRNEDNIRKLLTEEIVSRYYYKRGRVEASFRNDNDVIEARNLFEDLDRYKSILAIAE